MGDNVNKAGTYKPKEFKTVCVQCKQFNPKALILYICTVAGQCPAVDLSDDIKKELLNRQEII